MAENMPNIPTGAVPPKKETGKVQPKKETVRINLPPKPSAAPTIKMPALPGGPTGAAGAAPLPPVAPSTMPPPPPPRAGAAAPIAPRPMAMAPRTGVATVARAPQTVGTADKALAIAAAVVALIAVGTTVWIMLMPT
jgi:hypothetical protein